MMAWLLIRACMVTLGIVAITQIVSFAIGLCTGEPFTLFTAFRNTVALAVTALPASMFAFWQSDQLKGALAALDEAHKDLEEKSRHDAMTGFLNREAFFERLKHFRRRTDQGALLLIDADHFKSINDTYGHLVGDEALKLIADAIGSSIRDEDLSGRIGGEEFCIFLPNADVADAHRISERVRYKVEKTDFYPDPGIRHRLTVSIGVAFIHVDQTISQVMRRADLCLYKAKEEGRNRIVMGQPIGLVA
ncbi:MAG: GGDEF domain-containing protein [Phyllobacterium sp.]